MEYCVAVALLRGKVLLGDFTDEKVNETMLQDLIPKISNLHPRDWDKEHPNGHEVVVVLKNGTEYSHEVTVPKGSTMNPMTDEEFLAKFRDCASLCLPQTVTEQVLDMVDSLESLDNISKLMERLTYGSVRTA